jgi:uncharacterized protein DUF4926
MDFNLLECVVLSRDLPDHGLRTGDLGAVVDLHEPDGLEVEFVTADGRTQAVVTLRASDVRKVGPRDMVAVRPVQPAA